MSGPGLARGMNGLYPVHPLELGRRVAAELETELKTEKGLITRHCNIVGREEFTDFSWGEARRKKEPQTPVEIQKSITVKGPLKLKP